MIKKVDEDVFVIGTGISSNSVLIVGKRDGIVVDTTLFPERAKNILKVSRELGCEVSLVINTHYHPDHTFGNAIFEGKRIVSHRMTVDFMERMDEEYIKAVWKGKEGKIVVPNEIFDDRKTLQFDGLELVLIHMGGHTPDSTIVFIPQKGILITGDIVMNNIHAEIVEDSELDEWLENLQYMIYMKPRIVIPGHGEAGDLDIVKGMYDYLQKVKRFLNGALGYEDLVSDSNVRDRKYPELFLWGIDNLIRRSS